MTIADRWLALIAATATAASRSKAKELFAELDTAYGGPNRFYHTWEHIDECLSWLDHASNAGTTSAAHRPCLEYALFYHDAVYRADHDDNEAASADLAARRLGELGVSDTQTRCVRRLILATRHMSRERVAAARGNGELPATEHVMTDIDLAILGSAPPRYERYARQIKSEHAHLDAADFASGRRRVIESFLQRECIYATRFFHDRLEERARANLRGELASIGSA